MKLSFALLATAAAFAEADPQSAAARFREAGRRLSWSDIAGYAPGSQVTDHCALDLDQKAMEDQLSKGTEESYAKARAIYNNGGHSKSYAKIDLTVGLKADVKKGDQILGKNADGTQIGGKAGGDSDAGDKELKIYYSTTDVQADYVGCRVGALPDEYKTTTGCFAAEGDLTIAGEDYAYVYNPDSDNRADRTIAKFSTDAKAKMLDGCKGCPYADFEDFYEYYGKDDLAHHWIESAFDGKMTQFMNGNADFSKYGFPGKEQVIKKGTVYLNIFLYVVRELEDALDDCTLDRLDNNYNSVHAWDEGVCFYTGSLEGEDGAGSGKLLHALADKRCQNFKTCGENGSSLDGTSSINMRIFDLFAVGNHQLEMGECGTARKTTEEIVKLMYVPFIQGALRYAYKVGALKGGEVEQAEGAVFSAAVLPKVHAIDPAAAKIIHDNMKVGATSTDHKAVKKAYESVYEGMGITCADVGGLWFEGENDYYEGMEPCGLEPTVLDDSAGSRLQLIASLCMSAFLFFSL